MARPVSQQPTEVELNILNVLWRQGACSVKQVHEALGKSTEYTTVLKMMRIMMEKNLVQRDESQRAHVYRAVSGEQETQQHVLRNLLPRLFHGSRKLLILQALSAKPASAKELNEILSLIREMENKK